MSGLFDNAVGSIRVGVQDFGSDGDHRHISAVRNYYAGLLLLAKEVLVRRFPNEDPDKLIASNLKPIAGKNGTVEYVPATKTTIDFATIGRRFTDLGIPFNHKSLDPLNKIRNDVEHKFSSQSRSQITEAIAKGFPVVTELFNLIDENPAAVLGAEWQTMITTKDLYELELAECRQTVSNIKWKSTYVADEPLVCPDCNSSLVRQADDSNSDQESAEFRCRGCGNEIDNGSVVEKAVSEALDGEAYMRRKDTSEDGPVYTCSECDYDTYIDHDDACANCGYTVKHGSCNVCDEGFLLSDLLNDPDMTLCPYHQHVFDKDD